MRCLRDVVVPTPVFVKPAAPRLPVDGVFEGETATALQIFVGLDVKRDFANMDITSPWISTIIKRMVRGSSFVFRLCFIDAVIIFCVC